MVDQALEIGESTMEAQPPKTAKEQTKLSKWKKRILHDHFGQIAELIDSVKNQDLEKKQKGRYTMQQMRDRAQELEYQRKAQRRLKTAKGSKDEIEYLNFETLHYLENRRVKFRTIYHKDRGVDQEEKDDSEKDIQDLKDPYIRQTRELSKLIVYIIFLVFIFVIVFVKTSQRRDSSYQLVNQLEILLKDGTEDISTKEEIFLWLKGDFLGRTHTRSYYNGDALPTNGGNEDNYQGYYTASGVTMTLGLIRLRQLRTDKSMCQVPAALKLGTGSDPSFGIDECYPPYYSSTEFHDLYTKNASNTRDQWEFRRDSDGGAWTSVSTGTIYGKGGYIEDLPVNSKAARSRINHLQRKEWIEENTRALFVDLSWYNVQVDLFVTARISFEIYPTGSVISSVQIGTAALISDIRALKGDSTSPADLVGVLMEFFLYVIIYSYLFHAADEVIRSGSIWAYISHGWNCLDMVTVLTFIWVLVVRLIWMILASNLTYNVCTNNEYKDGLGYTYFRDDCPNHRDDDSYYRIRNVAYLWRHGQNVFAVGIILNFCKSFKYMRASDHLEKLCLASVQMFKKMHAIVFTIALLIVAYAFSFHILLGSQIESFKTLYGSGFTIMMIMLGSFNMDELQDVSPYLGVAVYMTYSVVMIFVVLMMLLTLADDVYQHTLDVGKDKRGMAAQIRDAIHHIYLKYYLKLRRYLILVETRNWEKKRELNKVRPDGSDVGSDIPDSLPLKFRLMMNLNRASAFTFQNMENVLEQKAKPKKDRDRHTVKRKIRSHKVHQLNERDIEEEDLFDKINQVRYQQVLLLKFTTELNDLICANMDLSRNGTI